MALTPFPSPIGRYVRSKPNLAAYLKRIFDTYYPDLRKDREEAEAFLQRNLKLERPSDEKADHRLRGLFDPTKPKFKES